MNRFYDILNDINKYLNSKSSAEWGDRDEEEYFHDLENDLEIRMAKRKLQEIKKSKSENEDYMDTEEPEKESLEEEMMEYKKDFYDMSVGSLRAIANHAQQILDNLENPQVNENLTESWLQGKIAITEDYMRTIHDFVMYVADAADKSSQTRPGLWENIRKKRERMGKKYKPAKPGDKDRPDPDQWKKLTK